MSSNHHIILSVGCNTHHDAQMARARECLTEVFPGIRFTEPLSSPAYGMPESTPPYSNMLAELDTEMDENSIRLLLKEQEHLLGDTKELRSQDLIMMDLDILQYDDIRRHEKDWERPYVIKLMQMLRHLAYTLLYIIAFAMPMQAQEKSEGTELLSRALEYYHSGKYHETVLTFEKLQRSYTLNPRYKAYLGFSYFKEGMYEKAIDNLKIGIPELTAYSPREQSVYIFTCAESYFNLERYEDAIAFYKKALPLVTGYDKGDILYHTALSYYMIDDYSTAYSTFTDALALLKQGTPDDTHDESAQLHRARIRQAENMMRGLSSKLAVDN